jgi:hypothetical protein
VTIMNSTVADIRSVIADTVRHYHEDGDSKSASAADLHTADGVLELPDDDPELALVAAAWGGDQQRLAEVVDDVVHPLPTRDGEYDAYSWQRTGTAGLMFLLSERARDELDDREADSST